MTASSTDADNEELRALREELARLRAEVEALRAGKDGQGAQSPDDAAPGEDDPLAMLEAQVDEIRQRAEEIGAVVREEVERRPLQALAIAAGIGWLLGRLGGGR